MKKEISYKEKKVVLTATDSETIWFGDFEIKGNVVNIEVFSDKSESIWDDFIDFLNYFENGQMLNELILKKAPPLLNSLAISFWDIKNECILFKFSGINFYGVGTSLSSSAFNYELVFDLSNANGDGIDDSYANWLVTMSNNHITGVRREQI